MKTLTQAWELIQLLSSLHFLSPTLVRANSPQTYTLNCTYSEEEVENNYDDSFQGWKYIKHMVPCKDRSCNYYKRLIATNTSVDGDINTLNYLLSVVIASTFITGGLSLLAVGAWTVLGPAGLQLLDENERKRTVAKIENELKEKWEAEQRLNKETNN
jgi:hypothetical protein